MATAKETYLPTCIKEPVPAIFQVWNLLSAAVDAHVRGDSAEAERLFESANAPEVYEWGRSESMMPHRNVKLWKPEGDTTELPKVERHPMRAPTREVKSAVLARDGFRCRYCGMPVVDASIRRIAHALYPDAVPWHPTVFQQQHAAFQCLWLQYDHVLPHSHGGSSFEENIVISCHLCNFGKDRFTIRQLGISDPRLRPPEPVRWDGLERLRKFGPARARVGRSRQRADERAISDRPLRAEAANKTQESKTQAFFLPGAYVQGQYLYTPPLVGKWRWFKLGSGIAADPATRNGVDGYRLTCDPEHLLRRGLTPAAFLDHG